jgi:hypothetical protein
VVGNLKGVRIAESYTATASGVPAVNYSADPFNTINVIKPTPGKQAYVTFGAGVGGQDLNDALHKSGLFTMAAASGKTINAIYATDEANCSVQA